MEEKSSVPNGTIPSPFLQKTILLVEDHYPNILVVTSMLEMLGYRCDVAINGMEALSKFQQNHYDLVLMDIQMPKMDGWETTQKIRSLEQETARTPTPVVAMTAHVEDTDRIKCAEVGMNGFIGKPFKPEMLQNILENFAN